MAWAKGTSGSNNYAGGEPNIKSLQATSGSAVSIGDIYWVAITHDLNSANPASGVSLGNDSLGNAPVGGAMIAGADDGTNHQRIEIWLYKVTVAGTPTITVQFLPTPGTSGVGNCSINLDPFTGSHTDSAVDGTGAAQRDSTPGTGTDAINAGTWATTSDGDLIYGAVCDTSDGADNVNLGTGFSAATTSGGVILRSEYMVQTTHSSGTDATWTTPANGSDVFIPAGGAVTVGSAVPSAALSGTVTGSITEIDVVAGGKTIILTLTNDTWVAAGATFNAQRQAIINGLTSAQSETHGWNNEVRDKIAVTDVVRTSASVVTITLDAEAAYDITATETITATIPGAALVGANPLVATPTFTVSAVSVALSGTVTSATENDIRAGGKTILLTLTNDTYVASGATFNAQRQNIINGMVSAGAETHGWNNEVQAKIAVTDVVRTSNTLVTITLDAEAAYDITATETITVTVPGTALTGGGAVVASPTFNVTAVAVAMVTGYYWRVNQWMEAS